MKIARDNILREVRCGTNVSYVLADSNLFFLTGFKVLQGLEKNGFLRCVKTMLNGQIQLVYLTHTDNSELKSLKAMLNSLDASSFAAILRNWIAAIAHAKTVGFLHCPNIATSIDHVYVDPKTYEVYMIYLPVMEFCAAEDQTEFESEFRATLIHLIDSTPGFRVGPVLSLRENLIDGSMDLDDIVRTGSPGGDSGIDLSEGIKIGSGGGIKISGGGSGLKLGGGGGFFTPAGVGGGMGGGMSGGGMTGGRSGGMTGGASMGSGSGPTLTLDAIRHATSFHQVLQPRTTVLGRADPMAKSDIQISNNPYISNPHCEISFDHGTYYVKDESSNGTYINGRRLQKFSREELHNGDELRLANSSFRVTIGS